LSELIKVIVEGDYIEERPFTPDELKQFEIDKAESEKINAVFAAKEAEVAAKRKALLDKLGISEEEAKLLLS